jgi:tetraacyldisaccharide 4'-kinase
MIYKFFEDLLFYPKWYHYPFIFLLFPFSLLYYLIVFFKFPRRYEDLGVPIISIGNIIVGGSGKTPFSIALANKLDYKVAVVLRGYKRNSKGLVVVKNKKILVDTNISGDEAMEIAISTDAIVIVSEDRKKGILKAKSLGAEVVILDDGFDKPFKKFNIVIDEKIKNPFVLPAGGYRYPRSFLKYADVVTTLKRKVKCPKGDILISAISKPNRLLKYCNLEYKFFPDHYDFKFEDIKEFKNKVIVCTKKDFVKLKKFDLKLKVIDLQIEIEEKIFREIEQYLLKFYKKGK